MADILVLIVMHDFWTQAAANARLADSINFQENMALLGTALVMLAVPRPWAYAQVERTIFLTPPCQRHQDPSAS